jgi:hypothetical protein
MSEHYFIVIWNGLEDEARSMPIDTYPEAKTVADDMATETERVDIRVIEINKKIIYRPKQRERCWSCDAMVLHDAEGKCPECGEWDLPF